MISGIDIYTACTCSGPNDIMRNNPQLTGILCVITGMLVFIGNDSSIKYLSGDYPIHQIVLVRTLVALCITLIITQFEGGLSALKTRRPWLHAIRGMLIVIANLTYFLALAVMPLAETMALFFVAPLLITMASALILREDVGIRRWIGVGVGMVGMLVIINPGSDTLQLAALLPLIAAVCYTGMQVLTRVMAATDRASAMAFYIQISFLVVSTILGLTMGDGRFAGHENASLEFLFRAWKWPNQHDALLMGVCGICVGLGGYLVSQGYRLAQASIVAPFEYVALPWGMAAGFVIFGEIPTMQSFVGIALIVGAGLYVLKRESIRGRKRPRGYGIRTVR
ncbi:MAG: drug/metabolite transporter (DMT)-like permease [Parasphingorhabdus sp.]